MTPTPLPETGVGIERRVPEAIALPDFDHLAVDHAADLLRGGFGLARHAGDYRELRIEN
jgi:hypothetical protein